MEASSLQLENKGLKEELDALLCSNGKHSLSRQFSFSKFLKAEADIVPKPSISIKKHSSTANLTKKPSSIKKKLNTDTPLRKEIEKLRVENATLKKKLTVRGKLCYCKRCDDLLAMGFTTKLCKVHGKLNFRKFV